MNVEITAKHTTPDTRKLGEELDGEKVEGIKIESTGGNPGVVTSYVTVPDIDSTISIFDLFGLVKTFDKEFRYNSVNPAMLNENTRHHSGGERTNVKASTAIEKIMENAVLLNTNVSERDKSKKSVNTAMLHKLYTPITYNGKKYLAVITVEEFYDEG